MDIRIVEEILLRLLVSGFGLLCCHDHTGFGCSIFETMGRKV